MFTFGFYDSKDGDRKYNSEQMSSIFDGIIEDGVYSNVGEALMVIPGTGMRVVVKTGRAWFKHTWSLNDAYLPLSIDAPDVYRNRIDAVVLEVNKNLDVRANEIKVITGVPATVAQKPAMKHEEGIDQYALAYVTIEPGVNSIVESKIEIAVGKNETPFVQCPLKTVSIEDLFNQWQGEFDEWFDNVQSQLEGDIATNLQNQIDRRVKIADKATEEDLKNATPSKWVDAQLLKESGGVNGIENGTIVNSLIDLEKLYPDEFVACDGRFVTDEKLAKKYGILNRPAIKLINSFTPNAQKWINYAHSIYLGNPSNGNITKDGWVVFVDLNYGANPGTFRVSCLKFDDDGTITRGAGYPSSYRNFVNADRATANTTWFLNESVLYFIALDAIYTYTIGNDGSAVERGTFNIRTFFDSPSPYGYRVYAYIVDKENVAFIAISSSDGYNANNNLNNSIGAFYTTDNGLTLTKGSIDNLSEEFSVGGFASFTNVSRTVPFNEPFCNLIQMDKNGNLFVAVDYVPSSDRPTNPVVFKSYDSGKTWRVFYKKLLGANVTINRDGSFFGIVNDVLHIGVLFSSSLSSSYGFIDHVDSETGLITEAVSKIDQSLVRSQNRNIAPVIYKYDNVYYISKSINNNYIWDFDNPSEFGVLIPIPNGIYPSGYAVSYNDRLNMNLANPKFIRSTLFMDAEQTVQVDGLNMTGTIVDLSNSESVAATGEFSRYTGTNGYLYYSNTGHKFYTLNASSNNISAVNVMEFGYKLPNKPNHYLKIGKYDV